MKAKEQAYLDKLGLISFERMEVFDLLIETLLKKREDIILSGDNGIGKTTLLTTLEREKKDQWTLCLFYGTTLLSFSDIKDELRRVLRAQGNIPDTERLHDMLGYYAEHEKRIILILDNAERFPSGFIEGLIQYSLKYPALKIVFVLTKKQLLLKNKTDKAVDHCYFIEIPVLDKKQTEAFLTMLSVTPDSLIIEEDIKPKLINQLYIGSKGIPGVIIAALHKRKTFWFRWRKYILSLLFLLLAAGTVYHYSSDLKQNKWYKSFFLELLENPKKKFSAKIEPTLLAVNDVTQINQKTQLSLNNNAADSLEKKQSSEEKPSNVIAITQTPPTENIVAENIDDPLKKEEFEKNSENTTETPAINQPVLEIKQSDEQTPLSSVNKNSGSIQKKTNPTKTVVPILVDKEKLIATKKPTLKKKKPEKKVKKIGDNSQWALRQSARKYTLQLIATPKKEALLKVLTQYSTLKNQLKYIGVKRNNKQQYLLLYGSFSSVASAQNKVKTLPKQFKSAWPKQFGAIQSEIKKSR